MIGDLFEKDFSNVAVGSKVAVSTPAYSSRVLQGNVSYIDIQSRSTNSEGMFEQRKVKLGELMGEYFAVLEGSFLLRAENLKGSGGGHQHM